MRNPEYWNYDCNLSRRALSDVMYATALCGGAIPSMYTIHTAKEYTRKQNARNSVMLKIKLPEGEKEEWEEIVGGELEEPTRVSI